jgi:hypothetical protein
MTASGRSLAVLGYSFLLKSSLVNNRLLADNGPTTPVTAYSWSRPILLKNSLFEDDEKLLAHLTDLLFFDTRGYESRSKVRCGATNAARYKKHIGFPKWLVLGKKITILKFGVFQQNRSKAALHLTYLLGRSRVYSGTFR